MRSVNSATNYGNISILWSGMDSGVWILGLVTIAVRSVPHLFGKLGAAGCWVLLPEHINQALSLTICWFLKESKVSANQQYLRF